MQTQRKLTRSNNGMIGGVMQGIADCYGFDPTIVRILFLLVSVLSAAFPGILVYIFLWIIIPGEK